MSDLLQRFRRIAPFFRAGRAGLVAAMVCALIAAATEPLVPALMKPLLDSGFAKSSLPLWTVPAVIIGLFAVRGVAGYAAQWALAWSANRAVLELRKKLFAHLMQARSDLFTRHSASQLTNMLVFEVHQGAVQLTGAVMTLLRDSLTLLGMLGFLLYLNWKLTLFVAVLFPAVGWSMRLVSRRLHRITVAGHAATDELAYVVEENAQAWRTVRVHQAQAQQTERFESRSKQLAGLAQKAAAAGALMSPVTQLLSACAIAAVITLALWQSTQQGTTVGGFVAFITAMGMLVTPIKHLSDVMPPITRGLAALERGLDMMARTPVEQGGTHAVPRAKGHVELRQVALQYGDRPALQGVSLQVRAGQTVALVGPSGAGKSTLVQLLPRFAEPDSGEVLLDGVPLRDWRLDALRTQFAFVTQEVVLFNDSIAANVALGGEQDEARLWAALEGANLKTFVQGLPQGAATVVGHNGGQLSGGQRQRLAIARALYKNAPLLILDEATSALDSESERAVQSALATLMQGRTTFVIAHRLSTIEHADRVVVLDNGRIVEQGPPGELLAAGGLYARLHAMQFNTPHAVNTSHTPNASETTP